MYFTLCHTRSKMVHYTKNTGAQLRHNDIRIFADPSRIFTYNCDETFKTTSWNLSEKMPEHA